MHKVEYTLGEMVTEAQRRVFLAELAKIISSCPSLIVMRVSRSAHSVTILCENGDFLNHLPPGLYGFKRGEPVPASATADDSGEHMCDV